MGFGTEAASLIYEKHHRDIIIAVVKIISAISHSVIQDKTCFSKYYNS